MNYCSSFIAVVLGKALRLEVIEVGLEGTNLRVIGRASHIPVTQRSFAFLLYNGVVIC